MKKIATLLLAAGLVFGVATGASAIDFKAKGQWIMSFDYGQNGNFTGGNGRTGYNKSEDEFEANQRVRLQLDAVASESLSGTVFFEIGKSTWGKAGSNTTPSGGALGADDNNSIKLKNAYIDWLVPQTDLKVRMGIQGMALPSFTTESQVFNDDVAGITASYQFNENVAVTALWARPYNDNYVNDNKSTQNNYMDNVDVAALLVPLTFDGVKVTPWVMYAAIGPNAFRSGNNYMDTFSGTSGKYPKAGMIPAGGARHKDGSAVTGYKLNEYGNTIWAGLTGEVTMFDPIRIAWDVNYGSASYDQSRLNRSGWLASLLAEYKLDWAIPGIYGWYGSGDDSNPANGSERMPSLSVNNSNNGFSNFAFNGNPYIAREATLGYSMSGTWGVGARLKDMSFLENLKHTLRVNLIGGTNSPTMAKKMNRNGNSIAANGFDSNTNAQAAGMDPLYMTTEDYAMEVGLTNTYKMYDNFTIMLDAAYLATWLDQSKSVWGNSKMNGKSDEVRDPWNVNVSFVYSF